MPTPAEILANPDFVNANAATKQAIFDKHVATDPAFANANSETQQAIKTRFGLAAPSEGMPIARREPTMGEQMLGTPLARIALGAATPLVGAVQAGANIGDYINQKMGTKPVVSKAIADWWNNVQAMKEKGMETPLGANTDYMGLIGNVATGVAGLPSKAVTAGQKMLEGAKIGGAFGYAQPGTTSPSENLATGVVGAGIGAAAPVVVPPLARAAGWVVDTATGQLTKVKAADLARQAAGDQINAIRAALSGAPADVSPAQATSGIQKNTFQALLQLSAGTDANSLRLKNQYQDQFNALARMAEGGNATEARAAQERSKELLNQLTADMRATELGAANQAGQTINQLTPKLEQKRAAVVQAVRQGMPIGEPLPGQAVVHPGTEAAQADVRAQTGKPGWLSNADRTQEWQQTADTFGKIADQRRTEAGFIERQIGSLADHGLQPLDTSGITSALDSTINAPGTRASPILTKTLQAIKDDITTLAEKNGGVIDAHDLYTLRKEGLSERIAQLLGPTDPKTSSKLTAKVLTQVRPLIDKAIEDAGGTGWGKYLNTYSQGMQAIDQKAMAAEAMRLFEDSPDQYVKLVRGNNTDAVEAIFGKGSYDIFKEMGSKMPTLNKIATELEQNDAISKAAKAGAPELANILDNQGLKFRFPFMNRATSVANLAISDLEGRVSNATMAKLRAGTATNQSTLELLDTLPTADKNEVLKALVNYGSTANKAATATVATQPVNALAGVLNKKSKQNALAP